MRVGIVTSNGTTYAIEVAADIDLLNFKAVASVEVGVALDELVILREGHVLEDDSKTLEGYGVQDGDLLMVTVKSARAASASKSNTSASRAAAGSSASANQPLNIDFSAIKVPGQQQASAKAAPADNPENIRKTFLKMPEQRALLTERNPDLAAVLNDPAKFREVYDKQMSEIRQRNQAIKQLAQSDYLDQNAQQLIYEGIQKDNLDKQLEQALEENPEFYAKVTMLYIDVTVGNHAVKAFIDSGAQMTIMSLDCARRCELERMIDRRFSGIARGVGEQKIVGRIHKFELMIGGVLFETSFQVLEKQEIDLLIGLDMLRRHQACIDLKRNTLVLGNGYECHFLHENELPEYARLNSPPDPYSSQPLSPPTQPVSTTFPEETIAKLRKYGYSREEVLRELAEARGDPDKALAALIAKGLALAGSTNQKRP